MNRSGSRGLQSGGHTLVLALALSVIVAVPCQAGEKGTQRMEARDRLTARIHGLPDDVYLRQDRGAVAAVPDEALALDFTGLVLGAPRAVSVESTQALPALLLSARTQKRSTELDWQRNAMVVASDVEGGEVYAGEAFPGDDSKSPGPAPGDAARRNDPLPPPQQVRSRQTDALLAELGAGDTAGTVWLDFRKLLALPAESGRWALRVIYFDEVSNPAFVEVRGKPAGAAGVSPDAALKVVSRIREAGQTNGLPRYYRTPDTPQLNAPGVAAVLATPKSTTGVRPLALHGAMRLEVSPQSLVHQVGSSARERSAQTNPPAAVLRAMVLVVMKDRSTPVRIPLEIPVWSERTLKPGDLVDAAFSIDIAEAMPKQTLAGTYQVYVVGGHYLSGPYPLTLVPNR
ncbi:MAG: hypothetical protein JWN13_1724 [Betaproteobacteria bacterium]|jgi:hypothetical protein|nr:hypothetical protein [Betaproteobacteria bacterium]